MKVNSFIYKYSFLTLSVLLLIFCVYRLYVIPNNYGINFTVIDTNSNLSLEPIFLKEIDKITPLPGPEPMYVSLNDDTTGCGGWRDQVVLKANELSLQDLLKKVDKTIDSIRLHDLQRKVNLEIKFSNNTKYQTFISILDLFEHKNSMIYGLHKENIYWIE
ncbi:hypothetical protein P3875_06600 [Myroides sp. JBRI-B21084]|uniref:hypothetical protein n=1 Tax=Myroides sp. JBRI-B21084 TaxID=3119977 RepID=UPI0026E11BC5|nr:hypothetical protein [Paenimyroides cloacae]WKW45455.1 hypothetical protein P3875_06600 [Paenimyroides cloacae]